MSRFGRVSDNTCCHGNALNIFRLKMLNLERGAIKPMLPHLHIFTKFAEHVYDCRNMSVKIMVLILKDNMSVIADGSKINDMFYNLKYCSWLCKIYTKYKWLGKAALSHLLKSQLSCHLIIPVGWGSCLLRLALFSGHQR